MPDRGIRITVVGPAYPGAAASRCSSPISRPAHRRGPTCGSRPERARGRPGSCRPARSPRPRGSCSRPSPVAVVADPLDGWRVDRRAARRIWCVVVHYTTCRPPVLATSLGGPARYPGRHDLRDAVPHERRPGYRLLTTLLMRAVDAASCAPTRARGAGGLTEDRPVAVATLPRACGTDRRAPGAQTAPSPLLRQGPPLQGRRRAAAGTDRLRDVRLDGRRRGLPRRRDLGALIDRLGLRDQVDLHPAASRATGIPDLFASRTRFVLPCAARQRIAASRSPTGANC